MVRSAPTRASNTVPPERCLARNLKILFDDSAICLSPSAAPNRRLHDYEAVAESPENRVLRFRPLGPDDPPGSDLWFPVPKEYAIGFPPDFRKDNGGIAIGYGYNQAGNINRAVCAGTLWTSGEKLRMSPDPAIARLLQPGGLLAVNGLQGNAVSLLRPLNAPPLSSYFADYYGTGEHPAWSGHLGDLAIWRICPHAQVEPVTGDMLKDATNETPDSCPAGYTSDGDQCVPPRRARLSK